MFTLCVRSCICLAMSICVGFAVSLHAADNPELASKPVTIVFLGDSLTAGYGLTKEQSYPTLVGRMLNQQGFAVRVINGGISGSTSASAESRLRWYLQAKPDVLFLALGANDGLRGLSVDAMFTHLQKTTSLAQQNGIRVVLAGMHVPPNYGAQYATKFHHAFQKLGASDKVQFIPFLLEGVAGEAAYNLADGIHPNEAGHLRIAEHVTPTLVAMLRAMQN